MDALSDRIVGWLVRLVSTALVLAGVALFVAGIPLLRAGSDAFRDILIIALQIGGAWVLLGLAAIYVSRRPPAAETHPGGWMIPLVITLLAAPAWLVIRLQPFLGEWRAVATLLSSSDLWQGANANMSGVLLVPVAAGLTPPTLELVALAGTVAVSMLMLIVIRSRRFANLYVASVLVLAALVAGSLRGASAAAMTADALLPWIEESKPRPEEYAQIRGVLDRYRAAVTPTATTLGIGWLAYAIWIPPVVLSARRR